jgi:hypothetical protein
LREPVRTAFNKAVFHRNFASEVSTRRQQVL